MAKRNKVQLAAVELCAGAGGQAIGLCQAGFAHEAAVEIDGHACATLRLNRPDWPVFEADLRKFSGKAFRGIDLLAGGVPCPPFSMAGKQLGPDDERDLFPEAIRLVDETRPAAILLENVRGLASDKFASYRDGILKRLKSLGYVSFWRLINSSDHAVPQLRPRFLLVSLRPTAASHFKWPMASSLKPIVGEVLADLMAARGWPGAKAWAEQARTIAPTIVGGSKKHGGPDLGPTRARAQWKELRVDGLGVANEAPGPEFPQDGHPKLTLRMVARIQGFPDSWQFTGGKTAGYRQVGNAFPPPVARAVGISIRRALEKASQSRNRIVVSPAQLDLDRELRLVS